MKGIAWLLAVGLMLWPTLGWGEHHKMKSRGCQLEFTAEFAVNTSWALEVAAGPELVCLVHSRAAVRLSIDAVLLEKIPRFETRGAISLFSSLEGQVGKVWVGGAFVVSHHLAHATDVVVGGGPVVRLPHLGGKKVPSIALLIALEVHPIHQKDEEEDEDEGDDFLGGKIALQFAFH